jgi:hypothetical protein
LEEFKNWKRLSEKLVLVKQQITLDANEQKVLLDFLNQILSQLECEVKSESDLINIAEETILNLKGFRIASQILSQLECEAKSESDLINIINLTLLNFRLKIF